MASENMPKKRARPTEESARTQTIDDVDDKHDGVSDTKFDDNPAEKRENSADAIPNNICSAAGSGRKRHANKKTKRKQIAKFGNYKRHS